MLKLTHIARLSDGLTLCALLEDDKDPSLQQYRNQRKKILNELAMTHAHRHSSSRLPTMTHHHHHQQQPLAAGHAQQAQPGSSEKLTIESGPYNFHILIDAGVCYMVLCEKQYSTQLAHSFLEDLRKEFSQLHGREVDMVEKNYAFLKFDTYIHKAIRVYSDTRTKRNIQKLKEELSDVQQIVRSNIEDIVGRREKLASMTSMSDDLSRGTGSLKRAATKLNRMYFWRTYGPIVVVLGVVLLMLLIRYFLF